ncbi:flavoprotein [Rhizomonospora bruguierae]|uniref:flavoprotein n=1 Tax=Rhizomonospora bruguierae TaxID=1581705 RepID=UPI001BCAD6E4|nr:flavoprotein [Micromonospora sp. NBRC 107566]
MSDGHLQIVVCGAGPASDVARLIVVAREASWTMAVTATASAANFIDIPAIERLTGNPVRTSYQTVGRGRRVPTWVDALIIAPATYNTVNKIALGIADSYPLTSIAELIGRNVPTVVVPFVNAALAARAPFQHAVATLRQEGVRVLLGPDDGWEPHPPGGGAERQAVFPWATAFRTAAQTAHRSVDQ